MTITGGCRCPSSALQNRCGTDHSAALLVSRLPIYRRGFRHGEHLFPERGGESRGRSVGLYEPRSERQPNAPAILTEMRDAPCSRKARRGCTFGVRAGTLDDLLSVGQQGATVYKGATHLTRNGQWWPTGFSTYLCHGWP